MATQTLLAEQLSVRSHTPSLIRGRTWLSSLLALIFLGCGLWHLHILNRWMHDRSDFIPPWVGARVALTGGDPYAAATTIHIQQKFYGHTLAADDPGDKQAFAYPLYTVFLIAPLAGLDWPVAQVVFLLLAIPAIALATVLWLRILGIRPPPLQHLVYALFVLGSWPFMVALRHCQLTLLALALVTAACFAMHREKPALAGFLLGLATFKPQLVAPVLLWLIVRAILEREWRLPASLTVTLAAVLGVCQLLQPGWFAKWLKGIAAYHLYTHSHPSLQIFFGPTLGNLLLAAVSGISLLALYRLRLAPASSAEFGLAVSLALAVTTAIIPTNLPWVYNQALLLPGCLYLVALRPASTVVRRTRTLALFFLAISYLAVCLSAFFETVIRPTDFWDFLPYANLLLPSLVAIALASAALAKSKRAAAAEEPRSSAPATLYA